MDSRFCVGTACLTVIFLSGAFTNVRAEMNEEATQRLLSIQKSLDIINKEASEICYTVREKEQVTTDKLEGEIKIQVSGLLKSIVDAGGKVGGGKEVVTREGFSGEVLQTAINNSSQCKLHVYDTLLVFLIPNYPHPLDPKRPPVKPQDIPAQPEDTRNNEAPSKPPSSTRRSIPTPDMVRSALRLNISEHVISQIWNGERYTDLRKWTIWLDLPPEYGGTLRGVKYHFHNPTFRSPKAAERDSPVFATTWNGYGCIKDAAVEATAKDGSVIRSDFDLCEVTLEPTPP